MATYLLETAPSESLVLKRSGPYGYFPLRSFATWQEWEAYKARNSHLWVAPDRLFEGPLPLGWAGSPPSGVLRESGDA